MSDRYIYIRWTKHWDENDVVKLGKASNLKDRESTYRTGEYNPGKFIFAMDVGEGLASNVEHKLGECFYNFEYWRYTEGGGEEFFDKKILDIITETIETLFPGNNFKILSKDEVEKINRSNRTSRKIRGKILHKKFQRIPFKNKDNIKKCLEEYREAIKLTAREYQQEVLDKMETYFQTNSIGQLLWACGLGKTLLSIFHIQQMKYKTICIGVWNVNLLNQYKNEILRIFPNKQNIKIIGGPSSDNIEDMQLFIAQETEQPKFIITTYDSCNKIAEHITTTFDFKIGDECHHLVSGGEKKETGTIAFHNIKSTHTLFMTATTKNHETGEISMDNEEYFGKPIDKKSINWAIENKFITDYRFHVMTNTEDDVDDLIKKYKIKVDNKNLFISALMTVKSILKYNDPENPFSKILVYTNKIENANIVKQYIDQIIEKTPKLNPDDFYNNYLASKRLSGESVNNEEELDKFRKAPYGIISCVYMFGEGFNEPSINGTVFADCMHSIIRIVQCLLRANRINPLFPGKVAKCILPLIDYDDWMETDNSMEKLKKIMDRIGSEDKMIEQRVKISKLSKKNDDCQTNNESKMSYDDDDGYIIVDEDDDENIGKQIRIRARYRGAFKKTPRDEFLWLVELNKSKGITTKIMYESEGKEKLGDNFKSNPETYLKSVQKSWYTFLGIDTSDFIENKQDWKEFIKKKIDEYCDQPKYEKEYKNYDCLPEFPGELYDDFEVSFWPSYDKLQRRGR